MDQADFSQTRGIWQGSNGNALVGDVYAPNSPAPDRPAILLLHGGGQTRHAWLNTARALAEYGFLAIALDQRGHGESDWDTDGAYAFADFGDDLEAVARQIGDETGRAPVVVGASIGGLAALLAQGKAETPLFSAMIFVDITPQMRPEGVEQIESFMRHRAGEGFETLDDAGQAIAAYLPHRKRPISQNGLRKNLRLGDDGRWYWHWDPRFLDGPRPVRTDSEATQQALFDACERITQPALAVRGQLSELIDPEHLTDFCRRVPHLEVNELVQARHMVAGDQNDAFGTVILDFLDRHFKTSPLGTRQSP